MKSFGKLGGMFRLIEKTLITSDTQIRKYSELQALIAWLLAAKLSSKRLLRHSGRHSGAMKLAFKNAEVFLSKIHPLRTDWGYLVLKHVNNRTGWPMESCWTLCHDHLLNLNHRNKCL